MRKNLLQMALVALSLTAATAVRAADVVVVSTPPSSSAVALRDVVSIKFASGKVTVSTRQGSVQETALTDATTIKFGSTATGITQTAAADGIRILYSQGWLSAEGASQAHAAIYSLSGQQMAAYSAWDGTPVSTAQLPSGVYVFKVNNKTLKFVKK